MKSAPWSLVAIVWRDAFDGVNGWTEVEKYEPEEAVVCSVGWLWPNCLSGYVTIVNSYMPEEPPDLKTVGMPTHIPLGMVIQTYVLHHPF